LIKYVICRFPCFKIYFGYFVLKEDNLDIMKILLDIKDEKAAFVIELLKNFKFVKVKPLTPYKAEVLEGLKEAVEEINQIKTGKKKAIPLSVFLDEL